MENQHHFQKIPQTKSFSIERTYDLVPVFINVTCRRINLYCQFYHRSGVACRGHVSPKGPTFFIFSPFTKTLFALVLRIIRYPTTTYNLQPRPSSLTFASINKGRRSKRGAGSRLSSESLRVVLRFPLRSTPRRPRVSVHAILVVPRVYIRTYICVYRRGVWRKRERERRREVVEGKGRSALA